MSWLQRDVRNICVVLGAIDAGFTTLDQIVATTSLDKKTVRAMIAKANSRTDVVVVWTGMYYRIEWKCLVFTREAARNWFAQNQEDLRNIAHSVVPAPE